MSPSYSRRALTALVAAAAFPAAALAAPGLAAATPMVESTNLAVSTGTVGLGSYTVNGSDPAIATAWNLNVSGNATWSGNLSNNVGWNTSYLRQGAAPGVSRMSLLQSGKLHVTWHVTGYHWTGAGDKNDDLMFTADASCAPMLGGSAYDCHASSQKWHVYREFGVPNGRYVNMVFHANFRVTPKGAIVSRTLGLTGLPGVTANNLPLTQTLNLDYPHIPCGPVGSTVSYKLGPVHYKPDVHVTQAAEVQEGQMDPLSGIVELPAVYDKVAGGPVDSYPAFDLVGSGHTTNLGSLQANNVAPTIASVGPFSGKAGAPITFSASASGKCSLDSYTWKFSNGTTSYGPTPQRTFSTPGVYDGELTVKDASGLTATKSFTITVTA
jgi:hypothetical protein